MISTTFDVWLSACGVLASGAIITACALYPGALIVVPVLAVTIPLGVYPFVDRILAGRSLTILRYADLYGSSLCFLLAVMASLTGIMSTAIDARTYHPADWPVNAFHFVSASFVMALANFRKPGHAWLELLSLVSSVLASTVLLLHARSLSGHWTTLRQQKVSSPFPGVMRANHDDSNGPAFAMRIVLAAVCAGIEIFLTLVRTEPIARTRLGRLSKEMADVSAYLRGGVPVVSVLVSGAGIACVCATLILSFFTAPRWVVMDSSHVLLVAGVLNFAIPRDTRVSSGELVAGTALLAAGLGFSTYAVIHTERTMVATLGAWPTAERMETEFKRGGDSFMGQYHYYAYGPQTPIWFAHASASARAVDLALCCVGSAYLVMSAIVAYHHKK